MKSEMASAPSTFWARRQATEAALVQHAVERLRGKMEVEGKAMPS